MKFLNLIENYISPQVQTPIAKLKFYIKFSFSTLEVITRNIHCEFMFILTLYFLDDGVIYVCVCVMINLIKLWVLVLVLSFFIFHAWNFNSFY